MKQKGFRGEAGESKKLYIAASENVMYRRFTRIKATGVFASVAALLGVVGVIVTRDSAFLEQIGALAAVGIGAVTLGHFGQEHALKKELDPNIFR